MGAQQVAAAPVELLLAKQLEVIIAGGQPGVLRITGDLDLVLKHAAHNLLLKAARALSDVIGLAVGRQKVDMGDDVSFDVFGVGTIKNVVPGDGVRTNAR